MGIDSPNHNEPMIENESEQLYIDYSDNSGNEPSTLENIEQNSPYVISVLSTILGLPRTYYFMQYLSGREEKKGMKVLGVDIKKQSEGYAANKEANEKIIDIYKVLIADQLRKDGESETNIQKVIKDVEKLKNKSFVKLKDGKKFKNILNFHINQTTRGFFSLSRILQIRKYKLTEDGEQKLEEVQTKAKQIISDLENYSKNNPELKLENIGQNEYKITLIGEHKILFLEINFNILNLNKLSKLSDITDLIDTNLVKRQIAETLGIPRKSVITMASEKYSKLMLEGLSNKQLEQIITNDNFEKEMRQLGIKFQEMNEAQQQKWQELRTKAKKGGLLKGRRVKKARKMIKVR